MASTPAFFRFLAVGRFTVTPIPCQASLDVLDMEQKPAYGFVVVGFSPRSPYRRWRVSNASLPPSSKSTTVETISSLSIEPCAFTEPSLSLCASSTITCSASPPTKIFGSCVQTMICRCSFNSAKTCINTLPTSRLSRLSSGWSIPIVRDLGSLRLPARLASSLQVVCAFDRRIVARKTPEWTLLERSRVCECARSRSV